MDSKYITIGKTPISRCYDSEEWHEEKQGKTERELRIYSCKGIFLLLLLLPFPHFHFFLFSSLLCWPLGTLLSECLEQVTQLFPWISTFPWIRAHLLGHFTNEGQTFDIDLKKNNALYLCVNVFSPKVLTEDTIFMSPNGDRTAVLRGHPSHAKV